MPLHETLQIIKEVGLPAAILFWLFTEGSRNQRMLARQMAAIQQELKNLTIVLHDALFIIKSKGGD